jgi:hypothetical protein
MLFLSKAPGGNPCLRRGAEKNSLDQLARRDVLPFALAERSGMG